MPLNEPRSREEALHLLRGLGAPTRLFRHGEIVSEVAVEIATVLTRLGVPVDEVFAAVGAALHDAGKISHPEEMTGPGHEHEEGGERLLIAQGVSLRLARVCRTHGAWDGPEVTVEERLIALADNLWRGRREERLEGLVVDDVACQLGVDRWQAFLMLESALDRIAAGASARLARAQA